MKFFIFMVVLVATVNIYAHEDMEHTDRFTANKLTRCECDQVVPLEESIQLIPGATEGKLISQQIDSKIYFNAATVKYFGDIPEGAEVKVEISTLSQDFTWSEWQSIYVSQGDVHFNDTCQAYRYKIIFSANEKGESPKIREIQVSYDFIFPHMKLQPQPARQSSRGIQKPSVISRSGWGARSPKNGYSYHSPRRLTVHHTYRPLASSFKGASTVRSIQNYHMDSNGWNDIGYHFLIGTKSGKTTIYQGRPENVLGSHTGGANTNNVGVNLVGDYDVEAINPGGYKAMIHTLAWLCDKYNISPNEIYGHKDFKSTSCPGQGLYSRLSQIKRDVRAFLDNGGTGGDEKGTLIGAVYNYAKGTSSRISGATVTLSNGQKVTTGSDGIFRFQIAPGSYSYTVSKSGYKTGSSSKTVSANETTWGSVGLK